MTKEANKLKGATTRFLKFYPIRIIISSPSTAKDYLRKLWDKK